jgi:hypothetical protein
MKLSSKEKRKRELLIKKKNKALENLNDNTKIMKRVDKLIKGLPDLKQPKIGRPKKPNHLKVQFVAMKLSPEYVKRLNKVKGPGIGSKVKTLLDDYNNLKQKQNKQINLIKSRLQAIENLSLSDHQFNDFVKFVRETKALISFLCYTQKELFPLIPKRLHNTLRLTFFNTPNS